MSQTSANTAMPMKQTLISGDRRKRVVPLSHQMLGMVLNLASRMHMNWAADVLKGIFFRVFKTKMKPWIAEFWQSADAQVDIEINHQSIPVRLWGEGPLVVMMHGWSGSGAQFRKLIPGLVNAGYKVASFDAPAHGDNPGKQTHLLEFVDALLVIQQQIAPIHTLMAHSFGAMAGLTATHRGLNVEQMVLFGPHLDVNEIHHSYSELLNLNPELSQRFHDKIGARMAEIIGFDNVWDYFTPENLLKDRDFGGLLIYDTDDEEIPLSQFKSVEQHWAASQVLETEGLGHHLILKDTSVIDSVLQFMAKDRAA